MAIQQYRQGDVLVTSPNTRRFDGSARTAPDNLRPVPREEGRVVLAHGELTGHAHAIKDKGVTLFRDEKLNELFLSANSGAALGHDEHGTIAMPPMERHPVIRQREYSPEAIRNVAD
jgi:hypothetical protein